MVTAAPAAPPLKGLDAFRQALPQEWEAFPDAKIEIKRIIGGDYLVAVESIWEGTYQKTVPGLVAAKGQAVRLSQMGIYTVKDQKITTLRSYYDPAVLVRQLGVSKAASSPSSTKAASSKSSRATGARTRKKTYPARKSARRYVKPRTVYRRGSARRTTKSVRRPTRYRAKHR
jgi:steroid delta-isomerase-like uncharacterized protein